MNKTEKLISILLGIALVWCFMSGPGKKEPAKENREAAETPAATNAAESASAATNLAAQASAGAQAAATNAVAAPAPVPAKEVKKIDFGVPDAVLENGDVKLELSSRGAVVRKATLKRHASAPGLSAAENPHVIDYGETPLGELSGVPGVDPDSQYAIVTNSSDRAVFEFAGVKRTYTLSPDGYSLTLEEEFAGANRPAGANSLGLGAMSVDAPSDAVSVDSWSMTGKDGEAVHHDDDDTPLKALITGSASGGCGCGCGAPNVDGTVPLSSSATVPGVQKWIALKDRFFVTALAKCDQPNSGFSATVARDPSLGVYRAKTVSAGAKFDAGAEKRTSVFFIGPKEQSRLWDLEMKDVMEFGMWRWVCYPILWLLKFFHAYVFANYGVAIILLTVLVRLVFWPLTRKSTEGMKKMQEIQPLLKELQEKYKDNPQRLQQETFALYREKKVNPLSSCLPMLIQIPVFIALFNVLRSSVELRYAGFLWISDLSEPEHLFSSWFPFGGLNILPLLMAATMYLQSRLTPSMGDAKQQKMMTVMMPVMMLVMFYNFASALSLYWTLSQVMSIIQMWFIRRATAKKDAEKALMPEVIDPPTPTRQQRRHG
ncbi:MAG: YidC/Oxa1 family insertase periplasmic-domain containing protein [Kiritimatiellae bacterium]|nr:YidC/Oxa1 family insertase periplasmic-domain containing protein [Kiritimatiellia bacterium]